MFLFALVGAGFLGDFIYRGIQIYRTVNGPVEYVLTSATGEVTDAQIAKLKNLEQVKAVTRQQEMTVMLESQGAQVSISCVELSADYLESVYGVPKGSSMKTFYLNQAAWKQLSEQMNGDVGVEMSLPENDLTSGPVNQRPDTESLQMEYALSEENGEEGAESESGTAKVVLLENAGADEPACAFCEGNSATLSDGADTARVQIGQQDLNGTEWKHFNQLGFEAANSEEVQLAALTQEMQFLRLKYDILVAALSFVCVGCLKKFGRR